MDMFISVEDYVKGTIDHAVGLPVPENVLRVKLAVAEDALVRSRDQVMWLEKRIKEKDKKIELCMAEATFNAQALKKQIMEYQRYVRDNEDLKSKCEGLSIKCELLSEDCSLYERDREMLVEFGNEAAEQANDANARALKAEQSEKSVAADLEFYKHEYMILKEGQSKAADELSKLKQRITELESMRSNNLQTEDAPCNRCSLMQSTINELQSQLLASVCCKDYQAIVNKVSTLISEKEHLRTNLLRAEEEVNILCEENNLLAENNKERKNLINGEANEESLLGSSGKNSSRCSSEGKRKSSSPKSTVAKKVVHLDRRADSLMLLPLQQFSPKRKKLQQ